MNPCAQRTTGDGNTSASRVARILLLGVILIVGGCTTTRGLVHMVVPEQRTLDIREPAQIHTAPLPQMAAPATVADPKAKGSTLDLPLDEAIRIALANAKVVRVLAGTTAVSSGKTIYDPAIANTAVDSARSVFDPVFSAKNAFSRTETPFAAFDPTSPFFASIPGSRIENYELGLGITKRLVTGGTISLDATHNSTRFIDGPAPLNPQDRAALTLSATQPLLQGAGVRANVAPILIARINTERSYFQLKDSMQDLTRGVIEAYWNVVFARTDTWVRRQQVAQAQEAHLREETRFKAELTTVGSVAQTKVALSNFKANLVAAEANLLQREAALRNILGLPPTEPDRIMPITPPTPEPFEPKWDEIVQLAGEMRPDLIELALILEADEQAIVQARNQALPRVDATTFYRWNGLEGTAPAGGRIGSHPQDWSVGVNFSVPLGLRDSRARLRSAELILSSDRAHLDQGLHSAMHNLAASVRNLAQFYEQYKAYRDMRTAAKINLEQQAAEYAKGRIIFLNVLLAITDWGNAISFEAQALAQYNIELANLERETGTILESHGIRFAEERSGFMSPLGRHAMKRLYPSSLPPEPNTPRYPDKGEPAEKMLEKELPSFKLPPPPKDAPKKEIPPQQVMQAPIVTSPRLGTPAPEPYLDRPRGIER